MKVKDAVETVTEAQGKLDGLTADRDSISVKIDGLSQQKAVAVRELALGDLKQQRPAKELDEKLTSFRLQGEGLDLLIIEAKEELSKAQEALKTLQQEEAGAESGYVAREEEKILETLRQGAVAREERLYKLYRSLCIELGEAEVDAWNFGDGVVEERGHSKEPL
jgi:hypothetical protein